jgi:hypothetical protein
MALPLIMRLLSGYDRVQMIPASVDQPQHGLIAGRPHCSLKLIRGRDWFTVHSLDHIATLHFLLCKAAGFTSVTTPRCLLQKAELLRDLRCKLAH